MTMELNATHVGSHLVVLAGERGDEFKPMVSARRLIGLQGPVRSYLRTMRSQLFGVRQRRRMAWIGRHVGDHQSR